MNATAQSSQVLNPSTLARLNRRFAGRRAEEIVEYALERFGARLVVASSFGAEDVVVIDMAAQIDPRVRIFTLDTGRLHQETYDVMDAVVARYGVRLEVMLPDPATLQSFVQVNGMNSFYSSVDARRACCHVRKIEPLRRALATADAWMTGLRRDQSVTRTETKPVEEDASNGGIVKFSPLTAWTNDDVWAYIHKHGVPYNRLHDHGFPSIGCAPCTRAVAPGEDIRAGRWWWENPDSKECGLHARYGRTQLNQYSGGGGI